MPLSSCCFGESFVCFFEHNDDLLANYDVAGSFFMICSDVELNPGPYRTINLNIAHLNIRSLTAHNKFEEVASAILNNKFDIFALSEK